MFSFNFSQYVPTFTNQCKYTQKFLIWCCFGQEMGRTAVNRVPGTLATAAKKDAKNGRDEVKILY